MRSVLLSLLLFCVCGLAAAPLFQISGSNDAEYTYRNADDSLKNYFLDKFKLTMTYEHLRFGMQFDAELPKYNRYHPLQELKSTDLSTEWNERYLEYDNGDFYARGGTIETTLGSGMLFRAWNDVDFDKDTRLDGFLGKIEHNNLQFTGFYGAEKDPDDTDNDNTAGGMEVQYKVLHGLTVAADGLTLQNYDYGTTSTEFSRQDVGGGRFSFEKGYGDMYVEYGHSKEYQKENIRSGDAFYAASNGYFGDWVVSGFYKQYTRFNYASELNDMPMVNHCGDPISETLEPGEDERGVMGEIRYNPGGYEFDTIYSEGWTHDWMLRQNNLYLEAKKSWESSALTAEYEHVETIDKTADMWTKEITPALSYDCFIADHPVLIKAEGKYKGEQNQDKEAWHYEPLLQTDMAFGKTSVSVISQFYFVDSSDIAKHDPWIGAEITSQIFEHTRLVFFAGREKGGKVCRNGVCRYVTEFEGVRLNLISQF